MTTTRLATPSDTEAIAETVAAAFATDPAWTFILGPDDLPARRAFAIALLVPRIRRGTVWVTDDCRAVAMWDRRPVDMAADPDHGERWAGFRASVGEASWERLQAYDAGLGALEPSPPFWYLGVLATHPDAQGRGLATAVLQPGLAAADAGGWDCWLETSTPANKAFYAGRGFTDAHEATIDGGPPTWWLRRPVPHAGPTPM